jgi:hypothetical protein
MQQITDWLANIGLERYAQAFIDNDIDVEVPRYLTDADLEKVGVSLGHRRKLLAAIAKDLFINNSVNSTFGEVKFFGTARSYNSSRHGRSVSRG